MRSPSDAQGDIGALPNRIEVGWAACRSVSSYVSVSMSRYGYVAAYEDHGE